MEKIGIKETKEALDGLNEVALFIIKQVKDGLQVSDAVSVVEKILFDAEFKAKIMTAVDGVSKIPAEIKDMDMSEVFDLGKMEVEQVQKLLAALK